MWAALRRHPGVIWVVALLAFTAAGTIAILVVWAARLSTSSDELAAAGVVLAGGTFALALLAAGLAAVAFAQSIRRPKLSVRAELVFAGTQAQQNEVVGIESPGFIPQLPAACRLPAGAVLTTVDNDGDATARNVTVLLQISGLFALVAPALAGGWHDLLIDPAGAMVTLAWEGGADYAVHPRVPRILPKVSFNGAAAVPGSTIVISAVVFGDQSRASDITQELTVLAPE